MSYDQPSDLADLVDASRAESQQLRETLEMLKGYARAKGPEPLMRAWFPKVDKQRRSSQQRLFELGWNVADNRPVAPLPEFAELRERDTPAYLNALGQAMYDCWYWSVAANELSRVQTSTDLDALWQFLVETPVLVAGSVMVEPRSTDERQAEATVFVAGAVAARTSLEENLRLKAALRLDSDPYRALLERLPAAVLLAWHALAPTQISPACGRAPSGI